MMTQASTAQWIRHLFLSVEMIWLLCFFFFFTCFGVSSFNLLAQKWFGDNKIFFFTLVAVFALMSLLCLGGCRSNITFPGQTLELTSPKDVTCAVTESLFTWCLFLSLPVPVTAISTPFGLSASVFYPFYFLSVPTSHLFSFSLFFSHVHCHYTPNFFHIFFLHLFLFIFLIHPLLSALSLPLCVPIFMPFSPSLFLSVHLFISVSILPSTPHL